MAGPTRRRRPLRNLTADAVRVLGGPEWLVRARLDAYERFLAAELPTQAEEIWRYSRIDDLDLDAYGLPPAATGAEARSAPAPGSRPTVPSAALTERAATVELRDGRVVRIEVDPAAAGRGLRIRALAESEQAPDGFGVPAADALGELASALLTDGVVVEVPRNAVIEHPVVIHHRLDAEGKVTSGRTLLKAGPVSQVTLVEEVTGGDQSGLFLPRLDLDLDEAANVEYVGIQALGRSTWQLAHHESRLGRDASLVSLAVAVGGDYARVRTDSRLNGPGGSSRLLALYFADGTQVHDFRTLQEHIGAKTTSDLLFKGAVRDEARGVYSGLIRVAKGAVGTNAFQTNRNLVLSEGATAWSVPNLEIEENDVRCSHASAVGPVDPEQLYYLESRGVPPSVAARLITLGFFQELLDRAPGPGLHEPLRRLVSLKLEGLAPAGRGGER